MATTVGKILLGCVLFGAGWMFAYRPALMVHINRILRDTLLNDRLVLLKGRKLAVLFFCLGVLLMYSGLHQATEWFERSSPTAWTMHQNEYLMYLAMQDFCTEKYDDAVLKYQTVLRADPGSIEAMKRLAYTYNAMGKKAPARALWKKVLLLDPHDKDIRRKIGS